jgi:hypothetical protein
MAVDYDRFRKIGEAALAEAEKIECSIIDFACGIAVMQAVFLEAQEAAEAAHKATGQ